MIIIGWVLTLFPFKSNGEILLKDNFKNLKIKTIEIPNYIARVPLYAIGGNNN